MNINKNKYFINLYNKISNIIFPYNINNYKIFNSDKEIKNLLYPKIEVKNYILILNIQYLLKKKSFFFDKYVYLILNKSRINYLMKNNLYSLYQIIILLEIYNLNDSTKCYIELNDIKEIQSFIHIYHLFSFFGGEIIYYCKYIKQIKKNIFIYNSYNIKSSLKLKYYLLSKVL